MDDKEIKAMSEIAAALDELGEGDSAALGRVLRWACDRYGVRALVDVKAPLVEASGGSGPDQGEDWADFADLFHAFNPVTDAERALISAYWLNRVQGQREFTGFEANRQLRELGRGSSNITDALTAVMQRRPALVMQTRKTGKSRQARKKYRMTVEGIREVESRIHTGASNTGENNDA